MRTTLWLSCLALISVSACQTTPTPATLGEQDRADIQEVTQTYMDAVNARDWDKLASTYSDGAVLMPPQAPAVTGRESIRAFFAAFPPITEFNLQNVEIDGFDDLAYVRGIYTLTIAAEGQEPVADSGKYLEIRRKQPDGSWLIVRDIYNSDVPGR